MSQEKSGFAGERIAKAIARAGVCSRRDAEAMILEGRVSVNGKKLTSPALNVTENDDIRIDGKPLPTAERTRLFRYYKPRGLVTTAKDPQGRPTVFASLPEGMPRVISVGRLDLNSEGLLLLTNDGGLARRLELPSTGWVRRYRVRVHGDVAQAQLDQLAKGTEVEGVRYGAVQATLDRKQGDNVWMTMSLTEGKNREIRKLCGHFGWPVSRLIRVAYGPFQLGHLEPGDIEEVPAKVLREQLGQKQVHQVSGQLKLKQAPSAAPAKERTPADRTQKERPRVDKRHKPRPKSKRHAH
jgi:23S rRNA pseudouridine2605 synthase